MKDKNNWQAGSGLAVKLILLATLAFSVHLSSILPNTFGSQQAKAATGDVILLWDGPVSAIPAGWTCVSCSTGDAPGATDAFLNAFPQAGTSYADGITGTDSVTHALTLSGATAGTSAAGGGAGSTINAGNHTHAWGTPILAPESILPPYTNLVFIKANNPTQIPQGVIGMFDVSSNNLPANWSYYSAMQNRYLRGSNSVSTGGTTTSLAVTTGALASGASQLTGFGPGNGSAKNAVPGSPVGHTHTLPTGLALNSQKNEPAYIGVVFAKANAATAVPTGLLAFFDSAMPEGWELASTAGSAWDGRLIMGTSTFGNTGGVLTQNNGGSITWTSSVNSGSGMAIKGNGNNSLSRNGHTHDVTYAIDSLSALPAHRGVMVGKKLPPPPVPVFSQEHYRWRSDNGAEGISLMAVDPVGTTIDSIAGTGAVSSITAPGASTIYASYACSTSGNCFGGVGLHFAKSTNGGATWTKSLAFNQSTAFAPTAIAAPSASTVYILSGNHTVGASPRVFITKSTDAGSSWSMIPLVGSTDNITVSKNSLAAPSGTSTVYAAYGNNGAIWVRASADGGSTWNASNLDYSPVISPTPSIAAASGTSTVYVAYAKDFNLNPFLGTTDNVLMLGRSTNGGTTWATSTLDHSTAWPVVATPNPSTVYVVYYRRQDGNLTLAKSTNGGVTWATSTIVNFPFIGSSTDSGYAGISSITTPDASTINVIYRDIDANVNIGTRIAQSTDGGATWSFGTIFVPNSQINNVTVASPAGSSNLYVGYDANSFMFAATTFADSQATFLASEDSSLANVEPDTTQRIRFGVRNTGDAAQVNLRLEYAASPSGPWTEVGMAGSATADWVMSDSSYFSDGRPTLNIPGGLTDANSSFVPGELRDATARTNGITLGSSNFTEVEYSIKASSQATPGQTYYFRLSNAGNSLNAYPVSATATIAP